MKANNLNSEQRPLSAKLSYVASDVSNLPDAIFALNEWTVKSASRGKIEKYLLEMSAEEGAAKTDGPLRTVIQRVLLNSNNSKQDEIICVGCANWITSILLGPACNLQATKGSNNKVAHSTTMKKAVGELLRRGRACVAQLTSLDDSEGQPTPEEFANVVSGSVLELLQRAAKEKQRREKPSGITGNSSSGDSISSQTQAQLLVRQAESEIAALTSKIANRKKQVNGSRPTNLSRRKKNNATAAASSKIVDLMSFRDRSKQIADKSGSIVEISVDCKKRFADDAAESNEEEPASNADDVKSDNEGNPQQTTGQYQSDADKNALMIQCLGSTLQLRVKTSVAEATSLESKIGELMKHTSSEKDALTSRQATVVTKRQEIASRMEQIRRELEELARQDGQLATEEKELSVELDCLVRKSDKEIGGLQSKIEEKTSHVSLDKELRRAVDKLGELEMAWIRNSTNFASPSPAEDADIPLATEIDAPAKQSEQPLPALLPIKLTNYLHRARSYFQSESACVELLRNRVSSAEAEVLDLEREIEAFSNLGMKNNVMNMKSRLVMLKSHVDEDNIVIDSLRRDAKEMREDLIRRVEEYYAVMGKKVEETQAEDGAVQADILDTTQVAALEGISIDLTGIGFYDDSDGGLGAIFSKIPKQASRVASPATVSTGSEIDCDGSTSYIGDIDTLPAAKLNGATVVPKSLAPVAAPVDRMPKFSWASKANVAPKKEAKSLLEIQQEEMAAAKNGHT